MVTVLKEQEYIVQQDFETTLEQTSEDFSPQGEDGIPDFLVLDRQFIVEEECTLQVHGLSTTLKEREKIKDVGKAFLALQQGLPIKVRSKVRFVEGQKIADAELAQSLIDSGLPVLSQDKPTGEPAEDSEAKAPPEPKKNAPKAKAPPEPKAPDSKPEGAA